MKRIAYLYATALPLFFASNAFATYTYDLTGAQFLQMMRHPEPLTTVNYMAREKAYSYLDGAKDATVGMLWCPSKPRKTFELAYEAAEHIESLTPKAQEENAAKILLRFLSEQYPCKKGVRQ